MPPPPARPTSRACRPPSSRSERPRPSATRTPNTPCASGPRRTGRAARVGRRRARLRHVHARCRDLPRRPRRARLLAATDLAGRPMTAHPPVPYDPELVAGLAAFVDMVEIIPLRADTIHANRDHFATIIPPMSAQADGRAITWRTGPYPAPPEPRTSRSRSCGPPRRRTARPPPCCRSTAAGWCWAPRSSAPPSSSTWPSDTG